VHVGYCRINAGTEQQQQKSHEENPDQNEQGPSEQNLGRQQKTVRADLERKRTLRDFLLDKARTENPDALTEDPSQRQN
jgi:hypothetical protein